MNPRKKKSTVIFSSTVVFAFLVLAYLTDNSGSQKTIPPSVAVTISSPPIVKSNTQSVVKTPSSANPTPADNPKSKYKNGTYTAVGSYNSPAGSESINVSVTISNDVITGTSATPLAQDGRSMRYEEMFISGYKQYVVGKSVDSVTLDYISGSSLTPIGFNDALAQIKSKALAS